MAWFTFTRRERNGILVLSVILFLLQSALVYRYFILPDVQPVKLSAKEYSQVRTISTESTSYKKQDISRHISTEVTAAFNPNHLMEKDWIALGLSPKQAAVISRWKSKGGIFRSKEDVMRMKVIPERLYDKIAPWLLFDPLKSVVKQQTTPSGKGKAGLIDLNAADTVRLCELPLIGPGRARTIWKFREKLGGYYTIEQLKEIRSIPDSVYEVIRNHIEIKTPVYRKIDVNSLTDTLYHPYISKNLLRVIIAYRMQNGPFRETTDLLKLPLVNEDLWRKIVPYIFLSTPTDLP